MAFNELSFGDAIWGYSDMSSSTKGVSFGLQASERKSKNILKQKEVPCLDVPGVS